MDAFGPCDTELVFMQGEIINESGTMTGGGAKPRGGRMCLGSSAPRVVDTKAAAAELAKEEQGMQAVLHVMPPGRLCLTNIALPWHEDDRPMRTT